MEETYESWQLNSYCVFLSRLSVLYDSKIDEEKRVILGMWQLAHDNISMDVEKDDVERNCDDEIDTVVYQSRLLSLWRNLTNKTKILWQERANTLNA